MIKFKLMIWIKSSLLVKQFSEEKNKIVNSIARIVLNIYGPKGAGCRRLVISQNYSTSSEPQWM